MTSKIRRHGRKLKEVHKHPLVVPVITFLCLFFASSAVLVAMNGETAGANDSHVVHVRIDEEKQVIPTRAETVGDFLTRAKIVVDENDVVEPDKDQPIIEDGFQINIYRAHSATIVDGDKKTSVITAQQEPRAVVQKAGITVYPEDLVRIATPDEALEANLIGEHVVVERAFEVGINIYGNPIKVKTRAKTVGDLLTEKNIKPVPGDVVTPEHATPITPGMQVFIAQMGTQISTTEEAIPIPTEYVNDPTLAQGSTAVRQEGSAGKKLVTYAIEVRNGQIASKKLLQEVIVVPPVSKVIVRGTKILVTGDKRTWMEAAGVSQNDYYYVDYIISRESGWCYTKWQGEYGTCPPYHGAPTSAGTGYGLCQATPGYKMQSAGSDWASNPVTQLRWCSNYAIGRYGSWANAYSFWTKNHYW